MRYVVAVLFVAGVFVVFNATDTDPGAAISAGWGILSGVLRFGVDAFLYVIDALDKLTA